MWRHWKHCRETVYMVSWATEDEWNGYELTQVVRVYKRRSNAKFKYKILREDGTDIERASVKMEKLKVKEVWDNG